MRQPDMGTPLVCLPEDMLSYAQDIKVVSVSKLLLYVDVANPGTGLSHSRAMPPYPESCLPEPSWPAARFRHLTYHWKRL